MTKAAGVKQPEDRWPDEGRCWAVVGEHVYMYGQYYRNCAYPTQDGYLTCARHRHLELAAQVLKQTLEVGQLEDFKQEVMEETHRLAAEYGTGQVD